MVRSLILKQRLLLKWGLYEHSCIRSDSILVDISYIRIYNLLCLCGTLSAHQRILEKLIMMQYVVITLVVLSFFLYLMSSIGGL